MDNHRVGKKKIAKQPCLLQHPKETKKGREKKISEHPKEREGKHFRQPEREGGEKK